MDHDLARWRRLCEAIEPLPPDVVAAFEELGDLQRDAPERAMLTVQHLMGGGVLNPVVEHVGDITHRMSHLARRRTVMGREKVVKTLQWLKSGYGFEREMQENIQANARYRKVDPAGVAIDNYDGKETAKVYGTEVHDRETAYRLTNSRDVI